MHHRRNCWDGHKQWFVCWWCAISFSKPCLSTNMQICPPLFLARLKFLFVSCNYDSFWTDSGEVAKFSVIRVFPFCCQNIECTADSYAAYTAFWLVLTPATLSPPWQAFSALLENFFSFSISQRRVAISLKLVLGIKLGHDSSFCIVNVINNTQ